MKIKIGIFVAILLLITLSVFLLKKPQNEPAPQITSQEITKYQVKTDWEIPEIPKDYDWEVSKLTKEEATDYRITWQTIDFGPSTFGDLLTPITLYYKDLVFEDPASMQYSGPLQKFGDALNENGWNNPLDYEDWKIYSMAADGVFGSTYGMVKIIDGSIRTVGYSYNMKPASWDGPGSDVVCPCRVRLEIFVGDPVNIANELN